MKRKNVSSSPKTVLRYHFVNLIRYDPHAAYKAPGDNSKQMMQKIYPSKNISFLMFHDVRSDYAQSVLEL